MKLSAATGFPLDTAEEVSKLIDEVIEIKEIVKEAANKVKEQKTEKVVRKVVKEEVVKEEIPKVPPEEFIEKYFDLEELLLHLVCLRKNKRSAEEWIRDTNEILEGQVGMREYRPVVNDFIREYLDDLRVFSIKINVLVKKYQI